MKSYASRYYRKSEDLKAGLKALEDRIASEGSVSTESIIMGKMLMSEAKTLELNWLVFRVEKLLSLGYRNDAGKILTTGGRGSQLAARSALAMIFRE